ncbi:MAG TPA: hypothetical protein GXZ61_00275 [Clostridiales bacterium]|jgi:hypothetical protein|nr:hypothetical protein [Clostridiales bacterium]
MVNKFIAWLKQQVGSIYVWGAQGEVGFNEDWIRKRETSEENAKRAISFFRKQLSKGILDVKAYDCSGLLVRFFLDNSIIHSDMSAKGLYSFCKKIKESDLQAGDLVFRHDGTKIHHVGVYIGDGLVIHAKGRDVGVVCERYSENGTGYWTHFGRMESLSNRKEMQFPRLMRYGGKTYCNLRSVPYVTNSNTVIGKVSAGDTVLVLGIDSSQWAEVIKKDDSKESGFVRGYCIANYLESA